MSEIKRLVKPNPIRFRKDTFEFLKGKIMNLNPGVEVDWEDLELYTRGGATKENSQLVLRIKESARTKYINPHKEVNFTYSTDISFAEIIRDVFNVNEVNHYDDATEFENWFKPYILSGGRMVSNVPVLEGFNVSLNEVVYKKPDGTHTAVSSGMEEGVWTQYERDYNSRIVTLARHLTSDTINESSNLDVGALIPILPNGNSNSVLSFLFTREDTATKDLNINGGEFTVNALGLQYSELTTPYVPVREEGFDEYGIPV